jgi:hypothetical protein
LLAAAGSQAIFAWQESALFAIVPVSTPAEFVEMMGTLRQPGR